MANPKRKNIVGTVKIGPNFAFHLMAAARVGFDSQYADRYASSVIPEDLAFIREYRDVLTFGGGSTSELVAPIIAWPAYFNLDSKETLQEQFDLLDRGWSSGDYQPFLRRYTSHIRKMERWWYTIDEDLLKMFVPQKDLIRSLGQILVRNFDAYKESVWPKELPQLHETARDIGNYFAEFDRIEHWEKIAGMDFYFNKYEIVLCSAIENGPNANSLGYDQVVFYSGTPRAVLMEFVSHEIGTHLLMDVLKNVNTSGIFDFPNLYEGYELLARYYNTIILGKSPLSYAMSSFHVKEYLEIYDKLYRAEPDTSPRDLLIKGIESFRASKANL